MKHLYFLRAILVAGLFIFSSYLYAQPKITAFSPASGPAGSSVIISGSGFNPDATLITVLFGTVRATVTGATPTGLRVTVPAGTSYDQISVIDRATGLTAYAATRFVTTFSNTSGVPVSSNYFLPRVDFSAPFTSAGDVEFSDIDGDGKLDLSYLQIPSRLADPNMLILQRNQGSPGTINTAIFGPQVLQSVGQIAFGTTPVDLDGDAKPDLLVQLALGNRVGIQRNTASPGAITSTTFSSGGEISGLSAGSYGDLDADGKPDIVALAGDATVSVLRNLSTPGTLNQATFAPPVKIAAGSTPISVYVSDLDGDGKPEIITQTATTVSVLYNTSSPGSLTAASFAAPVILPLNIGTLNVSMLSFDDLDRDGKPDMIASLIKANGDPTKILVLRNTSTPGTVSQNSFAPQVEFSTGLALTSFSVGDIDGNGKPDLIYVSGVSSVNSSNTISFLLNNSSPGALDANSFAAPVTIAGAGVFSAQVIDIDADGKPELVTRNSSTTSFFSVFPIRQQSPASVPVINGFSPASAPVGATLTINGSGFNPTPGTNIVFVGGVRAAVTAGTSTSLTVTVPAGGGYQPVSVLNPATGTAYSTRPFIQTFNSPFGNSVPSNFYAPRVDFATGALPYTAAVGDLDNDGKPDLVTANFNANTISVYSNRSATGTLDSGSFTNRFDLATGTNPYTVLIRDVDGDGRPDLVVGNYGSGTISVYINLGYSLAAFAFAPKVDIISGVNNYAFSIAVGDLDGDGKPDLVTANSVLNTVSVLHNTSSPASVTFDAAVSFPTGDFPRFVAVGDVNGDNKPDILTANQNAGTVSVLTNMAAANTITASSFAPKIDFAAGDKPISLALGDLNGDDKPDLAVANNLPLTSSFSTITAIANTSVGGAVSFGPNETLNSSGKAPFSIAIGDVTGDGLPDILAANAVSNTVSVLRHLGNISSSSINPLYAPAVQFPTGSYPVFVTTADINGDGKAEAFAVNAASSVSVFRIGTPLPPVITSFTPATGPAGTVVSVSGANFDLDNANNIVYFGAVKATVTGSGGFSNLLSVIVPAGATYQPLSVLNANTGLSAFAAKPFVTTFSTPFGNTMPANFYRPKVDFATGALPYGAALADLNGDGKPEMITANFNAGSISILTNTSATGTVDASSFGTRADIPVGGQPYNVMVSDLDGDGRLDIVVENYGMSAINVLRNAVSQVTVDAASFAPQVDFSVGASNYPFSVTTADLDGDGRPELISANSLSNTVSVLRNLSMPGSISASSFAAAVNFMTGNFPRSVVTGDLDGDGKPEVIVANQQDGTVTVLPNETVAGTISTASFGPRITLPVGLSPFGVVVGDLDGDGKPDIAAVNHGSNTVSVIRNTATAGNFTGAFASQVPYATGAEPFALSVGDVNGDGKADLVTANSVANTISVLRNTATSGSIAPGSFAARADYGAGGYPVWTALGDLDGDGKTEIAIVNAASSLSVLKINSLEAPAATPGAQLKANAAEATAGRNELQVYPNPSAGNFMMVIPPSQGRATQIDVFNEAGKSVLSRSFSGISKTGSVRTTLSLSAQPAGVYYVKVTSSEGVQVSKVVVQR